MTVVVFYWIVSGGFWTAFCCSALANRSTVVTAFGFAASLFWPLTLVMVVRALVRERKEREAR